MSIRSLQRAGAADRRRHAVTVLGRSALPFALLCHEIVVRAG